MRIKMLRVYAEHLDRILRSYGVSSQVAVDAPELGKPVSEHAELIVNNKEHFIRGLKKTLLESSVVPADVKNTLLAEIDRQFKAIVEIPKPRFTHLA